MRPPPDRSLSAWSVGRVDSVGSGRVVALLGRPKRPLPARLDGVPAVDGDRARAVAELAPAR